MLNEIFASESSSPRMCAYQSPNEVVASSSDNGPQALARDCFNTGRWALLHLIIHLWIGWEHGS